MYSWWTRRSPTRQTHYQASSILEGCFADPDLRLLEGDSTAVAGIQRMRKLSRPIRRISALTDLRSRLRIAEAARRIVRDGAYLVE